MRKVPCMRNLIKTQNTLVFAAFLPNWESSSTRQSRAARRYSPARKDYYLYYFHCEAQYVALVISVSPYSCEWRGIPAQRTRPAEGSCYTYKLARNNIDLKRLKLSWCKRGMVIVTQWRFERGKMVIHHVVMVMVMVDPSIL
jgi:hypothetical protein